MTRTLFLSLPKRVVLASNARTFSSGGSITRYTLRGGGCTLGGPDGIDERLKQVYEANAPLILQPSAPGPNISTFNFPATNAVDENKISQAADDIYNQQDHAFKLNL